MQTVRGGGGKGGASFAVGAVVKGTLFSLGVAVGTALLLSVVVIVADWSTLSPYLVAFHYVAIGAGGIVAARRAKRFGWLHGGIVGVLFTIIVALLFADSASISTLLESKWLLSSLWGFAAGVAGGVLGVNL